MRAFFSAERQLIDRLLTRCAGLCVSTDSFWASEFFNTQIGRALILQPKGAFGYFYLKTNAFDDPSRRQAELRALIDLLTLWSMLRQQGLIVVNHDDPKQGDALHFVGEMFENPHACPAHLALNSRGDFSFHPDAIQDADNNVIYKGMRLTGDLYRLVQSQVGGTVYPSSRLVELAVAWKTMHPGHVAVGSLEPSLRQRPGPADPLARAALLRGEPRARSLRLRVLMVAGLVIALVAFGWFAWRGLYSGQTPVAKPRELDQLPSPHPMTGTLSGSTPAATISVAPQAPQATSSAGTDSTADARTTKVQGIDLSKWNAKYLDEALATKTVSFVILRATYGLHKDPTFDDSWARLKQGEVVHGAYHFYLAAHTAQEQADAFLSAFGDPHPLRMAPIVDIEELSFAGQARDKSAAQVQADVLELLALLEKATGSIPIIYTNADIGNAYLNDPRFTKYPLWVADWTSREQPTLPEAWRDVGYRFWQRTDTYTFSEGSKVPVDMDLFNGQRSELAEPGS